MLRLDYVTTARSKGLSERVVVLKHVVRNAMIPVVTLVALQMPAVFGGAIVTASITNEAVDELGLAVGDTASAIIKASDVMVGKA